MVSAGRSPEGAKEQMAIIARQLKVEAKELRRNTTGLHEANADLLLREPLDRQGVTTDAEVHDTWPQRVISREELEALSRDDAKRADRRQDAMEAWASAATDLKHEEATADLL